MLEAIMMENTKDNTRNMPGGAEVDTIVKPPPVALS
jgi:hypothetical protein